MVCVGNHKDQSMGKIESMIVHLVDIIRRIKEKASQRLQQYNRSTRTNGEIQFTESAMNKFVIAMDNYFTLPKVVAKLRMLGIGIVGTAQMRKNCPPKELRQVNTDKSQFSNPSFNYFYYQIHDNMILGRWLDNNIMYCVSTIH